MRQYLDLLREITCYGALRKDRTGTGTYSLFGRQLRMNLLDGFPALTTKKVNMRAVWHELLWFLRAENHIKYLQENNVHIWDAWAKEDGHVGPIYGVQWRKFKTPDGGYIDQLQTVIDNIKNDPYSRRHIVTAWNPGELDRMALPPCHIMFQFYVRKDVYLDLQVYQRSADIFLGVPFDIASYATLCHMVAFLVGLTPGELIYTFGDVHLYVNHMDQAIEQLSRTPKPLPLFNFKNIGGVTKIDDFKFEHFELIGYDPLPPIKAPISV